MNTDDLTDEQRSDLAAAIRRVTGGHPSPPPIDYPALWENLHRRALAFTGNIAAERDWIALLVTTLPFYGCSCKAHWRTWVDSNPPDFSSSDALFAWTVKAHNAVNLKLGKPEWTLEEARGRWG